MKQHIKIYSTIKTLIPILLLLSVLLPVVSKAQAKTKEQLVIPLSKPDKPFKLRLGLEKGAIRVIAYDGKDILIDAEPEAEKLEKGEPNQNQHNNNNSNTNINNHKSKSEKRNIIGGKYLIANESNNSTFGFSYNFGNSGNKIAKRNTGGSQCEQNRVRNEGVNAFAAKKIA